MTMVLITALIICLAAALLVISRVGAQPIPVSIRRPAEPIPAPRPAGGSLDGMLFGREKGEAI